MGIVVENLVKIYGGRKVVDNVSLSIEKGEVVGLLGPNGAGKTTTFYAIVGIIKPNNGEVILNQQKITHLPIYKRARYGIGYLSQEASIFRKLSVEENILLILENMNLSKKERHQRTKKLLEEFHIEDIRKLPGYVLSGGERRRVEIARTLASEPEFILLDEAFTGIDPIAVEDIKNIISHLKSKNLGILITDHNVRDTLSIVERAYIIHQGKILVEGKSREVANSEIAKKFYLGEKFTL